MPDSDPPVLAKGAFYRILDGGKFLIMEDRTKRGLEAKSRSVDPKVGAEADKGTIYDMDGIGHEVPIRWYFEAQKHGLNDVLAHAERMEKKYAELRELTCPDDPK